MTSTPRREFLKLMGWGTAGAAMAALAHGTATIPRKPNILVLFPDQWRRSALGFMKADPVQTPNLDALAAESKVFTNAISVSPVCVPARGSLITGRYPQSNQVVHNRCKIPDSETGVAQLLKTAGYYTGYIGKWHLEGHQKVDHGYVAPERRKGFDYWYAYNHMHWHWIWNYFTGVKEHVWGYGWQPDHDTDVAIDFISKNAFRPFALFVAFAPPHDGEEFTHDQFMQMDPENHTLAYHKEWKKKAIRSGLIAPKEYEDMYRDIKTTRRENFDPALAMGGGKSVPPAHLPGYYGAITSIDKNIGRLLEHLKILGLEQDTIVIFSSDHGEMLGSHSKKQKQIWYEESMGVPFVIRWPGKISPGETPELLNTPDIVPTLLGLAEIEKPKNLEGLDFSPLLRGHNFQPPSSSFSCLYAYETSDRSYVLNGQHREFRGWRCLRTKRHSYVVTESGGKILDRFYYDLERDPWQLRPETEKTGDAKLFSQFDAELKTYLAKLNDPFPAVNYDDYKADKKKNRAGGMDDNDE